MNYPYYGNPYMPPMQDNLAQLRQQQMQAIPPMPQNPLPQSGVQWVSGEQEARSWMVAPNAAVALWDSTAPTVYLKQADASGKPTLKVYDLVERLASAPDAQKAPAAVENYFNVYVSAIVEVPRGCCVTVAAQNTSAEAVSFANSNLTIDRVS